MTAAISIPDLKASMIRVARRAYDIRLQSGDGGNLSIRIPGKDSILIKASGCSFGNMDSGDIVEVSLKGHVAPGEPKEPSREVGTHLAIYRNRNDVAAVFHSHSPWSTTASLFFNEWPAVSLPLDMKIGSVPVFDAGEGHSDSDVAEAVIRLLKENPDLKAFVQKRHGLFCMNSGIEKAEHDAELVEETAQIAMLARLGGVLPTTEDL